MCFWNTCGSIGPTGGCWSYLAQVLAGRTHGLGGDPGREREEQVFRGGFGRFWVLSSAFLNPIDAFGLWYDLGLYLKKS